MRSMERILLVDGHHVGQMIQDLLEFGAHKALDAGGANDTGAPILAKPFIVDRLLGPADRGSRDRATARPRADVIAAEAHVQETRRGKSQ